MNLVSAVWTSPLFFSLILGTPLPSNFNAANLHRRDSLQNTVVVSAMLLPRVPSPDEPPSSPTSAPLVATNPADSQPITQAPISAIFGGVMGGLLLAIACAIVFFCMRKRRRQRQTQLTQLTPTPMPKPQPSVHVDQIADTPPGRASPNGYSGHHGSGNHTGPPPATFNREGHKTNTSPLADNGIMGLEITSRKGVRNAIDAEAR